MDEKEKRGAEEHPTIKFIKENRHLFGPFKQGTVLQQYGDTFKPVQQEVPGAAAAQQEIKKVSEEFAKTHKPQPVQTKEAKKVSFDALPKDTMKEIKQAKDKLAGVGLGAPTLPTMSTPPMPTGSILPEINNPGLPEEFAGGPNILEFLDGVNKKEAEVKEKAAEETARPDPEKLFCDHCGWDQRNADPEEVSDFDKLAFIQAVMGQIPFKKSYSVLGDRVVLEFRTLESGEADACFTQVGWDARDGEINDEGQYFRTLMDYRLCLGLARFDSGKEKINLPESIDAWDVKPLSAKSTKLKPIVAYVYTKVLRSEQFRRAAAAMFFRFQRMVEKMEAHFDDPNFWPAIEKQP